MLLSLSWKKASWNDLSTSHSLYPSHTRGGMPSEWKFVLHSWIFEVHSKNSDCILNAFQIFGPILVAGPNVFIMLKTFEVHSKWKNIERHSKCILTALWLHSKYSYGPLRQSNSIQNILIAFEGESKRQASSNPARMSRMSRNAHRMHFDCCRDLFWY